MKKIIMPLAAIAVAIGFYALGDLAPSPELPKYGDSSTIGAIPKAKGPKALRPEMPARTAGQVHPAEIAPRAQDEIARQRQTLAKYGAKPLPTPEERAASQAIANSEAFQKQVFATLSGEKEFAFDLETEKERLRHLQVVMDVYRFGDGTTREVVAMELEELIFSTDFMGTPDIALRKSLAGDKIDFLRILKDLYPERFAKVADRIQSQADPLLTYCLSEV